MKTVTSETEKCVRKLREPSSRTAAQQHTASEFLRRMLRDPRTSAIALASIAVAIGRAISDPRTALTDVGFYSAILTGLGFLFAADAGE